MPTDSGRPSMMDAILAGEKVRMTVSNRDISFGDPVKSMIDGKHYSNKTDYSNHLKQHGCHEVGNDPIVEKKEKNLRGDFNVREAVAEATNHVLSKK